MPSQEYLHGGSALRAPRTRDGARFALWLALSTAQLQACSSLGAVYQQTGYDAQRADAVKRIAVIAWAPEQTPQLDELMARVATDVIKLRKNYLVAASAPSRRGVDGQCTEQVQGILLWRVLDVIDLDGQVSLHVSAELFRCTDGALLWRAEAQEATDAQDADLVQLSAAYVRELGAVASRYAAPIFAVVQDVVAALPDVALSDDEVLEKIELSTRIRHREPGARSLALAPRP